MKIKSVELQSAVTIHGSNVIGALSLYDGKYPGIKMSHLTEGLLVETKSGSSGLIPWPNVKVVNLEKSDAKSK